MESLYSSPLRVYLLLAALALAGIFAGLQLNVSLFPNSSKPIILAGMPYGNLTAQEFMHQYGNRLETQLREISTENADVEKTRSYYEQDYMRFEVEFKWGSHPRSALKEVETVVRSYSAQLSEEIRNQIWIEPDTRGSGFFIASFYSSKRSLDEVYKLVEPVLMPEITQLKDVAKPEFWNPTEKEVRIELNQGKMSTFQLLPHHIEEAVRSALTASSGGSITVGLYQLTVQLPRTIQGVSDFDHILITTPAKKTIHLTDVAKIDYDLKSLNNWIFKTSGAPSIVLFARPKPGGNIKRMSEDIIRLIQITTANLPRDIEYKVLVDPSEFIRSAVRNVFHEVAIGAFLAVLVLFLFIGSFKNTATAAIEIPLSMVLAFIPMKLSGMSINLISLGGLALSAGMNVDASVVVMENIFRHFEKAKTSLDAKARLKLVIQSVNEVKFAVISSTIASLVVFLPLAFTSDLSYAILGDLAKAVVFSHGFSAFVALILVPTVRLHLMSQGATQSAKSKQESHVSHSPIEKYISRLEDFYVQTLSYWVRRKKIQNWAYLGLASFLVLLTLLVIPNLPKEVIGKPDTQDLMVNINTQGNTQIRQMEGIADQIESQLIAKFGSEFEYTLINAYNANQAWVLAHLKNKSRMREIQKVLQTVFTNTPLLRFEITPFNPAELPIPDPAHMRIAIRGGTLKERAVLARDLYQHLDQKQVFPRLWTEHTVARTESVVLKPYHSLWSNLRSEGATTQPSDLANLVRVMTSGKKIGEVLIEDYKKDVFLRYPTYLNMSVEEISAIPLGLGSDLVPLKALFQVKLEEANPTIYQENQRELFLISGKMYEGDPSHLADERLVKARKFVADWLSSAEHRPKTTSAEHPEGLKPWIAFEDAGKDIHKAMQQLGLAAVISVALIFLILLLQFGDVINSLLVLVAIPLGLIGVLISLFVFRSTLSLNSILGVILLNGIAVANSIILVDFMKQRVEQGLSPMQAALDAAKKRLRPILITSLTTILGMLPVALGLGEGGRILQPLGIAVSGGLWVSMGLTLLIVPALQVRYLEWKGHRAV